MLFISVLVLLGAVPLAPIAVRFLGNNAPYALASVPAALFAILAMSWRDVSNGETLSYSFAWISDLSVVASWRLDGLSLTFALLVLGIGTLVLVYARGYMANEKNNGKFYSFLFLFMTAMLGLALSDNVITLFLFWELTSVSSYMLIGHKNSESVSRDSALQALVVTSAGGLVLLGGLVMLATAAGSWEISEILQNADKIAASELAIPGLVLVAAGAFAKSAQAPFHFWLPNAMAAPTPVSAYLHSATMVKAGVFLLARLHPALGELWLWTPLLVTVGGITMVGAAWQALRETDLKRALAYSTVSALGTMVFLLGLGHPLAVKAAVTFLIAHALYKGALFMIAGAIDHETGTRDITKLGGLRKAMPYSAVAAALAAISMAGIPPAFGFVGKESLFAAALDADRFVVLLIAVAVITSVLTVVVAGMVSVRPFTGRIVETPKHAHQGPFALWAPPLLLAATGIVIGILVPLIGSEIVGPASNAIAGEEIKTELKLWPGFETVLWLSIIAIVAGVIAFIYQGRFSTIPLGLGSGGNGVYWRLNSALLSQSTRLTETVQNGRMHHYIAIILLFGAGAIFAAMAIGEAFRWPQDTTSIRVHEIVIAVGIMMSSALAALTGSRLRAIAALGASGYGVAMLFVIYGAPDLGMTQILIETLTVILLVSAFRFLPVSTGSESLQSRRRAALVAVAGGGALTVLALSAVSAVPAETISRFFRANSKLEANGANIVNTILVDFRAIDTLGEIAVLSAAAIGVIALLRFRLRGPG